MGTVDTDIHGAVAYAATETTASGRVTAYATVAKVSVNRSKHGARLGHV